MPTPVLPDATVVARTALLAQSPVTDLVAQRVYYAIPANPVFPLLVLTLVDDDELRPETLTARVQVDVWGEGGSTQNVLDCKAIAAKIRSVSRDMSADWTGGKIRNAIAGQIVPNPDETSGRARFVVDLLLELNQ